MPGSKLPDLSEPVAGSSRTPDTIPIEPPGEPPVVGAEISRITVRAPPFWKANPALWFCQLEAQFEMNRITSDKSRYYTVVAAIESTVLDQVSDLVLNPPLNGLYTALKARLLNVFADSEQSRLKKLLSQIELGDQKPSNLLREMRNLAGGCINADILKTLWLQRLPSNMQAILSVSSEDLDRLVVMADKIHESTAGSEIHKINIRSQEPSVANQVAELTKQISELKTEIFKRGRIRDNSSSNRSHRSRSQTPKTRKIKQNKSKVATNTICWYHRKWGNKAKACIGNCDFDATQSDSEN